MLFLLMKGMTTMNPIQEEYMNIVNQIQTTVVNSETIAVIMYS